MVFVELEDGSLHGPLGSWASTHFSSSIVKIVLTDGHNLSSTLTGFDKYAVIMDGDSRANMDGGYFVTKVVAETIVGFRDLSHLEKELLVLYNEAAIKYGSDCSKLDKLANMYKTYLMKLNRHRVYYTTLGCSSNDVPMYTEKGNMLVGLPCKMGVPKPLNMSDIFGKGYKRIFNV